MATLADPYAIDTLIEVAEGTDTKPAREPPREMDESEKESADERKFKNNMADIEQARREWGRAKDVKHPPLHAPGPGEGSQKKVCVAPPKQAKCFAKAHSGQELVNVVQQLGTGMPGHCMVGQDHAWFRILCEQY